MKTNERRVTPDNDVIDLREVYFALKKRILLILAAGLIGSCLYGAYTAFFMEPLYTSTSSILVLSKETTLTSIADLQLGTQLAADYQVLIKSTSVMDDVIEGLDLKMSADQLRENISIVNPVDTRILEVSVTNKDGVLAKKIADKVVEVASEYIGDKMEVIPPKVIEKGKLPTVQTSPSMSKNVMMGFLIVLPGYSRIRTDPLTPSRTFIFRNQRSLRPGNDSPADPIWLPEYRITKRFLWQRTNGEKCKTGTNRKSA